jgi:hypothetical protein
VQITGTGLGKPQPREQRILGGIDADHKQRHLALGGRRLNENRGARGKADSLGPTRKPRDPLLGSGSLLCAFGFPDCSQIFPASPAGNSVGKGLSLLPKAEARWPSQAQA